MELSLCNNATMMEHKVSFQTLIETFLSCKDLKSTSRIAYISAFKQFGIFVQEREIRDITERRLSPL